MRELKQNPAAAVKAAAAGDRVVITERGKPVAQILPISSSPLSDMRAAGIGREAKRPISELPPPLPAPSDSPTLSEILAEMRAGERY